MKGRRGFNSVEAKIETSLPGMNTHSKINPIQGIVLLFLLLVIPLGVYVYQTQNIGEIRSQAGFTRINITPELCELWNDPNYGKEQRKIIQKCPEGQRYVYEVVLSTQSTKFGGEVQKETPTCRCKPGTGLGGAVVASTPNPTGTIVQRCNASCTSDAACGEGMVCAQVEGSGKCRNAQCYGVADCWCFKTTSPSPGPACNAACTTDEQCGTSFICVETASGNKCRNPQCFGKENCVCYSTLTTPTPPSGVGGSEQNFSDEQEAPPPPRIITRPPVYATPTPISDSSSMLLAELLAVSPTPNPLLIQPKITAPILTIDPFYDAKKQTGSMITLTGTSDPDAELDISIMPDGAMSTVTADSMGTWTAVIPTNLTNGSKQLKVIVRSPNGGQTSKTETFIVAGGSQFPLVAVILSILIAGGVGGYFLYRKMKAKKTPPPDQYVSTTPASFIPPDPTPTEKPPLPL